MAGRCGARLASLAGISLDEFLARTERVNLLDRYPGKSGKGDAFPMDEARRAAARLMFRLMDGGIYAPVQPVVLLGGNVAGAFHVNRDLFIWGQCYSHPLVAVAPHPSGISRWWNSPENIKTAKTFWTATLLPDASSSP